MKQNFLKLLGSGPDNDLRYYQTQIFFSLRPHPGLQVGSKALPLGSEAHSDASEALPVGSVTPSD